MKRKRGRKPGQKNASAPSVANDSPKTSASPSTDENGSADQTDLAPVNSGVASEPDLSKVEKASVSNNPADVPYVKPRVGAVYGRVRVKLKSTRVLEPHQSSSDAQTPNNADKSVNKVPEGVSEIAVEKDNVLSDGQTSESRGSDSDKLARKVGSIKIKSSVLSSVHDATQDKKANLVGDTLPNKQETVLENKESEDSLEPRNLPELEVKQPPPERHRDEKELTAALEAIKKVMKMDAAEPFNTPVDPVALVIPDYFDVIDTPMDFGTICQDLEHGNKYMNSEDVYKDVQFIWDNCTKYNSKGDYIMELMKRVKKAFMKNWLAAGLYSDMPDNGGNENTNNEDAMLASQEKGHPKSKSKHKRRRQGIDSHKYDCTCAVCNVTRRRKEKDEYSAAANENETVMMNSNLSEQHYLEGNSHVNNPGSRDATPSWEQPPQTDAYKELGEGGKGKRVTVSGEILQTMEIDTTENQMEDHGKRFNNQPSDLLPPDNEDEVSRQYSEEEEEIEYNDPKRQEELSTQPNDNYTVAHHQKAPMGTSQDVEMQDFPIQQENHSVLQLFMSLFPSNQRSVFRGPHSLFRRPVSSRESPIHAAIASIMKP